MSAFSAALGYAFLPLATDPHLIWNYGSAGILAFVAGCLFWVQMRDLDKQEDQLNLLPTGHVGEALELITVVREVADLRQEEERITSGQRITSGERIASEQRAASGKM